MKYTQRLRHTTYSWPDLKTLMARATPRRSGDELAGIAAGTAEERVAAQMCLADVPLSQFVVEPLIPAETDEVTRLIFTTHNAAAFEPVARLSVGEFRDWLLSYEIQSEQLAAVASGLTPEMAAAVSKICANQDLILIASKCRVVTKFRNTIGLPGRLSVRLQPNHPTDDPRGIAISILDGLLLGSGDAVIGINPASDSVAAIEKLLWMLDELIQGYGIPTQSCVLGHVTTTLSLMERGAPVDLVFQSIAGTQAANASFGFSLSTLDEAMDAARHMKRGTLGENVMYFETGQGSCLSADAHFGVDQQTLEARAYGVARHYSPLLVNTVVGFIGPEYLYDGKQIIRAGLEDHFCGKLLGVPMGCDVCYTNHAEADQDDMDNLMTLLSVAGLNFMMGIPGADDVMLNYQTTSFHDAQYLRQVLGKKPAPEFEAWLERQGVTDISGQIRPMAEVANGFAETAPASARAILPVASNVDLNRLWSRETEARVALPRAGASIATPARLDFQLAHSSARDAVHWPFQIQQLAEELSASGGPVVTVESDALNRDIYLQRPDLGRRLTPASRAHLESNHGDYDLAIVFSDGLSALALERHAAALMKALNPLLKERCWRLAPLTVAAFGRVAVQDEIGQALGARASLIVLGERPGLGTPDSLGAYLVFGPRPGNTDEKRNCVSNIRPGGLAFEAAATKLDYLISQMLTLELSGVELKDDSEGALVIS